MESISEYQARANEIMLEVSLLGSNDVDVTGSMVLYLSIYPYVEQRLLRQLVDDTNRNFYIPVVDDFYWYWILEGGSLEGRVDRIDDCCCRCSWQMYCSLGARGSCGGLLLVLSTLMSRAADRRLLD